MLRCGNGSWRPFLKMYPPAGRLPQRGSPASSWRAKCSAQEAHSLHQPSALDPNTGDKIGQPRRFTTLFVHAALDIDDKATNNSYLDMLDESNKIADSETRMKSKQKSCKGVHGSQLARRH
jgi:hypothetical protein